jgi:hypothetical protein
MYSTSEREPSSGENSMSSVYVVPGRLELALDVDVAGRDEGVDARALRVLDRVPGRIDVLHRGAGEAADDRAVYLARDRLDRLEVAGRGDREAGLDDVGAETGELVRDLDLLVAVERDPWGLLAVAQRGVEDLYSVALVSRRHVFPFCALPRFSCARGFSGRHASFPPKGEKEKSQIEQERHAVQGYTPRAGHPRIQP